MSKADEVMRGLGFKVKFKGRSEDDEYRKILNMIRGLELGGNTGTRAVYFEEKYTFASKIRYRGVWFKDARDYVGERTHASPQVCLKVEQDVLLDSTTPNYELVVKLNCRMIEMLGKQLTDLIEYVGESSINYEVDYINYHGLDRGSLIRDWTSEKVSDAFIGSNPLLKAIDPEVFGDKYKVNIRWHQSAATWLTARIATMSAKERVKLTCGVYERLMTRGIIPSQVHSGQLAFDRTSCTGMIECELLTIIERTFNENVSDQVRQALIEQVALSRKALQDALGIVTEQVRQPHKWIKRKYVRQE